MTPQEFRANVPVDSAAAVVPRAARRASSRERANLAAVAQQRWETEGGTLARELVGASSPAD